VNLADMVYFKISSELDEISHSISSLRQALLDSTQVPTPVSYRHRTMESGEDNRTATILGTIGTVFWCIQLVPQIWYNWRRKKTEGLPVMMGFLWAGCMSRCI
jgi:hypothetical protein